MSVATVDQVRTSIPKSEINDLMDQLSLDAIKSPAVQKTEPGTLGRRAAVRAYVVQRRPGDMLASQFGREFDRWVRRMRAAVLKPSQPPLSGVA